VRVNPDYVHAVCACTLSVGTSAPTTLTYLYKYVVLYNAWVQAPVKQYPQVTQHYVCVGIFRTFSAREIRERPVQ